MRFRLKPVQLLLALFVSFAAPIGSQTTGTITAPAGEMPDADPLKPNERRIPRVEFTPEMEQYWGVKLAEVEDEFVRQKGDETLFIDAGGRVYIKKVDPAQGYYGETGKSYASTEQMLEAEKRWEELAEYLRRVREKVTAMLQRDQTLRQSARIRLESSSGDVSRNSEFTVRITSSGGGTQTVGLALSFNPDVLTFDRADVAADCKLLDAQVRNRGPNLATLRLRIKRTATDGNSDEKTDRAIATLVFEASGTGETILQPLSIGRSAQLGKTFIEINNEAIDLSVTPEIRVRVR